MIIHNDIEQGSGLWHQLRLGKVTASNAHRLLTPAKFHTFYLELLSERLTNVCIESYTSDAMQWGIDQEPFALEWYEKKMGCEITTCAFIELENLNAGCSPDALVGKEGMIQVKCPNPKGHIQYIIEGPTNEIITQMQFEMFCYEAKWNDFLSFDPRYPGDLVGYVKRLLRDDALIKKLESLTTRMNTMIDAFLFDRNISIEKVDIVERKLELDKLSRYLGA